MNNEHSIFTVGHSTHMLKQFIDLLQKHAVTAVADVRSVPYSRWQPQFNQSPLKQGLVPHRISYVFLGEELGARSNDTSCYVDGRVQYRRLAETATFRSGIERLRLGSKRERIAVVCAEAEPIECHRMVLVARELEAIGIRVMHILPTGELESHPDAQRRLMQTLKVPERDMFRSPEELIDLAYAKQEARIAFVDQKLMTDRSGAAR